MAITAMRIKTQEGVGGATRSKTISPLIFNTAAGGAASDRAAAIRYMAQRIVGLLTSTYVATDMIVTTSVDTEEVTNVG